jgi:FkbM family methyltransferase
MEILVKENILMRDLIRKTVNGALGRFGYVLRRKHDPSKLLGTVKFATVIDGGANIGEYSAKMRLAFPNAEIHAFEPTPQLFRGIRQRFAGDHKTVCHEQALGDKCGTATFHLTQDTFSSSLLEETEKLASQRVGTVDVSVTTLDAWAGNRTIPRPALLKLDLEGNELAALRGGEKALAQIDYLEIETTFVKVRSGQPTFKEILNFMDDHGFELIDMYPGIVDSRAGRTVWADALFAKRVPPPE